MGDLILFKSDLLTCSSLHLHNLPNKPLRNRDLRRCLYYLFSTHGTVIDVVCRKTTKRNMRGQAHVVFKDVNQSTRAMRALQGFEFFGKEMVS